MPTEAQWEYACRAGTTTPYSFGSTLTSSDANFVSENYDPTNSEGASKPKPKPVKSYAPNAWGLYDMHGNVSEWTSDRYDENYYANSPDKPPMDLTLTTALSTLCVAAHGSTVRGRVGQRIVEPGKSTVKATTDSGWFLFFERYLSVDA